MLSKTTQLTAPQQEAILTLTAACCRHDHITLTYPLNEAGVCHYLYYVPKPAENSIPSATALPSECLAAVLSVLPYDNAAAECTAFTLPDHRKNGFFSRLLQAACQDFPECDFLFPVSGECRDTQETLKALGAQLESRELKMSREIPGSSGEKPLRTDFPTLPGSARGTFSLTAVSHQEDASAWILTPDGRTEEILGFCQTTCFLPDQVCLHHVEILPEYRRQGLGTTMLELLFVALARQDIGSIILQVSGSNTAAIALYQKTGFRITESLSYYLY